MTDAVTITLLGEPNLKRYGVVYKITNTINGKSYIGITTRNPLRRFCHHFHDAAKRSNLLLHRAMRKYERSSFHFLVIAEAYNAEELETLERAFIASHCTLSPAGYNLTGGGERNKKLSAVTLARMSRASKARWADPAFVEHQRRAQTGRKQSPELIAKRMASRIGQSLSAEHRAKLSTVATGRVISEAQRAKIATSLRGRTRAASAVEKTSAANRGRVCSPETRRKISKALKGRAVPEAWKIAHSAKMKGRRPNAAARAKLSQAQKRRWAKLRESK